MVGRDEVGVGVSVDCDEEVDPESVVGVPDMAVRSWGSRLTRGIEMGSSRTDGTWRWMK